MLLSDVWLNKDETIPASHNPWDVALPQSRWFRRGWTLQELLAPASVEFFSTEGVRIGDKTSLQTIIENCTGISAKALQGHPIQNFAIPDRLLWSIGRETSRAEDRPYCLQGIFSIRLAPEYGEGEDHAWIRLWEEIARSFRGKQMTSY